jgi:hypothetical protein
MEQNDRAHGSLDNTLKRAKATRGPSGYNLFCDDVFKRGKFHQYKIQTVLLRNLLRFNKLLIYSDIYF